MTVRELARRAMVDQQTVMSLLHGKTMNPGVGTLMDLARALEVPPEWLICGVDDDD